MIKKIAIAATLALATGTIATVAYAVAPSTTLTFDGDPANGTSLSAAVVIPVPSDNSVDAGDAVKVVVDNLEAGDAVSATSTNAKLVTKLATVEKPVLANAGSTTLATTANVDGEATFYVFTTTTADGSFAVKVGSNITTYYVKGLAGKANSVVLTAPAKIAVDSTKKLIVTTTDVFGNLVGDVDVDVTVVADGASSTASINTRTATTTLGTAEYTLTAPAVGNALIVATIKTADAASKIDGLTVPVTSVTATVNLVNFETEYSSLVAKYNKLAKKWNKKHSKKVALIK